ncbi:MAG TPA: ABC transporter permease [Stellaceae bacterium]|nr:ABC transporter permease [Stellaceae bacterium]
MSTDIARTSSRFRKSTRSSRANPSATRSPLWTDLAEGLRRRRLWVNLAWKDIRSRYRRTVIGPFWTVLSTGTLVAALGFVNSTLWHIDISTYLPFFCAGYISWLLFTNILNESGPNLIAVETTLKALPIPYSVFSFRLLVRNLIVFFHNLVIYIIVAVLFKVQLTASTLLLPVGLALALVNYLWISLILAAICARFRDIIQLVANLSMILFFVTPIFWQPSQLASVPVAQFVLVDANFIYHLIDVVRTPLLGKTPAMLSFVYLSTSAVLGFTIASVFFRRFYNRIAYWL